MDAVFTDMLSGCLLCEGDDNLLRLHTVNIYFILYDGHNDIMVFLLH